MSEVPYNSIRSAPSLNVALGAVKSHSTNPQWLIHVKPVFIVLPEVNEVNYNQKPELPSERAKQSVALLTIPRVFEFKVALTAVP